MAFYKKLEHDAGEDDSSSNDETVFSPPPSSRHNMQTLLFISTTTSILALIISIMLLALYPRLLHELHKSPFIQHLEDDLIVDCGNSRAEALKRGCTFNIMGNAWLPQICYDPDAAEAALSTTTKLGKAGGAGVWPWYADKNFTMPRTYQELAVESEDEAGWTWETYHVAHCLYDWRAGVKAMNRVLNGERNVWVHSAIVDAAHIDHCNYVVADQKRRTGAKTHVKFGHGRCVRLDGGHSGMGKTWD